MGQHERHGPPRDVDYGKRPEHGYQREDEQQPGGDSAAGAVRRPSGVRAEAIAVRLDELVTGAVTGR